MGVRIRDTFTPTSFDQCNREDRISMAVEPRKSENFYAKDLIKIKMLKRSH